MSKFIEAITPKDTEEVKPGLFIQKKFGKYRMIHPGAWDGKVNWKNFLVGANPIRHFIFFLIIVGLAWAYVHDISELRNFYIEVMDDPIKWCWEVDKLKELPECTQELKDLGMCYTYNYNIP